MSRPGAARAQSLLYILESHGCAILSDPRASTTHDPRSTLATGMVMRRYENEGGGGWVHGSMVELVTPEPK
ncbi:MAG TPA: hypothetical protein VHP37_06440 [Burkholderiales bacterium]|nr:hypothetical protein [Burkholderiales bacterium]